jgi:hypothetical protein
MALFRVNKILTGNKVQVDGWTWKEHAGTDVIIAGYNPYIISDNESIIRISQELAKNRLTSLVLEKEIELGKVISINDDDSITCIAYYNGIDIAKYFPEYIQNQTHI